MRTTFTLNPIGFMKAPFCPIAGDIFTFALDCAVCTQLRLPTDNNRDGRIIEFRDTVADLQWRPENSALCESEPPGVAWDWGRWLGPFQFSPGLCAIFLAMALEWDWSGAGQHSRRAKCCERLAVWRGVYQRMGSGAPPDRWEQWGKMRGDSRLLAMPVDSRARLRLRPYYVKPFLIWLFTFFGLFWRISFRWTWP